MDWREVVRQTSQHAQGSDPQDEDCDIPSTHTEDYNIQVKFSLISSKTADAETLPQLQTRKMK
jgi:hypothetical protein